jgi:hypothetical protein
MKLKLLVLLGAVAAIAFAVETTLAPLPSNSFAAPVTTMDQAHVDAVNAIVSAQNANNTSLRAGINAAATTPVPSSQLDPTTIQYATVALSNADLLALNATPKQIIAAAGANTVIEVTSAVLEYVKSTAFTIGSAGNVTLNYKSDASGGAISVALAATGFFDQSASQIRVLRPVTTNVDVTGDKNQGVYLTVATADMTGGSGSTGILKVAYRVHSAL